MSVDPSVIGADLAQATDPATDKQRQENRELAEKWLKEIKRIRNKEDKWRKKAKEVLERYRDDRGLDDHLSKFNILWSNTETIKPAIFARMPVPDVRRRYLTQDPVGRTAAMILERALSYSISTYDFKDTCDRCVEDYILPGRAEAFVCYEPLILNKPVRKPVEPLPPSDPDLDKDDDDIPNDLTAPDAALPPDPAQYPPGTQFDAQGAFQMQPQEYKAWESVYAKYVPWDLFGFSECTQWADVPAVWMGEYLTKEQCKDQFPDFKDWEHVTFAQAKTSSSSADLDDSMQQPPSTTTIWKVWHKKSRQYMVFAQDYTEGPIARQEDPTQLEGFFPMPQPMYSLRTNGTWIPKPEFLMYQDQANELDIVVNRLRNLVNALKVRGVYDKAMDELAKISELYKAPDLTFIPIPDYRMLAEKGGLEALISTLPIEEIAAAIAQLRERETELKQEIYEIYGVADIMRGATEASETLGAQQLKAQYGGLRISTRQERFQTFVRDVLRIKAELIAEHFDADTLRLMTGIQVIPDQQFMMMQQQQQVPAGAVRQSEFDQAIQVLKSDKLRGFKVDIETDSTIPVDRMQDQQNRIAFIQAVGQYLTGVIPAVQEGAIPMKVAREGLLFVVRGFKIGTELEEVLEELGQDGEQAQQMAQLQKMVPALQQQIQELQQELQDAQQKGQADAARAQADIVVSNTQAQNDIASDNVKTANTIAIDRAQAVHKMAVVAHTAANRPPPKPASAQ
jgi:hypothetical protein